MGNCMCGELHIWGDVYVGCYICGGQCLTWFLLLFFPGNKLHPMR